jgi:hypothetical protein
MASWISPKYLDSMVLLTKDEEQPISTRYLSPISFTLDRCVWENQVENIAGETETLTISNVSFQDALLSIGICLFTKLSTTSQVAIFMTKTNMTETIIMI